MDEEQRSKVLEDGGHDSRRRRKGRRRNMRKENGKEGCLEKEINEKIPFLVLKVLLNFLIKY